MIKDKLDSLIAEAMKNRENYKLNVLRLIKSEYQKFETSENKKPLDDANEIKILKKMQKQWLEEINAFANAGRKTADLSLSLKYLESFLPKEMTKEEQESAIIKVVANYLTGVPIEERNSMKHLGAIMKIINKEYPMINGKTVSDIYKNIIA